jgi:hypothetical protein
MQEDGKTCPECAETVKGAAKACKHCGYRFDGVPIGEAHTEKQDTSSNYGMLMIWIIGLLVAAALTAFVIRITGNAARTDSPAAEAKGKAFVTKDFLDPSSAQFEDVFSNDRCVTGKVNGKNAYGAYIGFQDFYFDSKLGRGKIPSRLCIRPTLRQSTHLTTNARPVRLEKRKPSASRPPCKSGCTTS